MTTTPNDPVQEPGQEPTEVPDGDPGVGPDEEPEGVAPRVDADEGDPDLSSYPG